MKNLLLVFCVISNSLFGQNLNRVISDSATYNDHFGSSVSVSGNIMAVGVPNDDVPNHNNVGQVHIYHWENGTWVKKQELLPKQHARFYSFGAKIIHNENYLFATFRGNNSTNYYGNGVIVFKKQSDGKWVEHQTLKPDPNYTGGFTGSLVLENNRFVISRAAYHYQDTSKTKTRHAEIYELQGEKWYNSGSISSASFDKYHTLDNIIDMEGNTIFINGRYSDPDAEPTMFCTFTVKEKGKIIYQSKSPVRGYSQRVFVFNKVDGVWKNTQILSAWEKQGQGGFGCSITSSGKYLIIGASSAKIAKETSLSGAVFVYEKTAEGVYKPYQLITAPDAHYAQQFGKQIQMTGTHLAIGVQDDQLNAKGRRKKDRSGACYLYSFNDKRWEMSNKFVDPKRTKMGYFGKSISLADSHLVIGSGQSLVLPRYKGYHNEGAVFTYPITIPTSFSIASDDSLTTVLEQYLEPVDSTWYHEQTAVIAYPNPTTGSFTLKRELAQESVLQVFSITGNLIFESQYNSAVQVYTLPDVPPGIYLLKIITGSVVQTAQIVRTEE